MIITCKTGDPLVYVDQETKEKKKLNLRLGKHNYPMLKPKNDPALAAQLFSLRKHGRIQFDGLLPQDKELLKDIPEGKDQLKQLARKVHLKPSPAGRMVNEKLEDQKSKEAKLAAEKVKDGRSRRADSKTGKAAKNSGGGGK